VSAIDAILKGDTRRATVEQARFEVGRLRRQWATAEMLRDAIAPFHDAVACKDAETASDNEFSLCIAVAAYDKAKEEP